jgi:large subunit ribosomal protein L17
VLAFIKSKEAVNNLFGDIAQTFADKNGGYCRVLQTGCRQGDGASMSILELAKEPLERKKAVTSTQTAKKQSAPVKPIASEPVPSSTDANA